MLLPHESTVAHEHRFIMDDTFISRTRPRQEQTVEENAHLNAEILNITQDALDTDELQKLQVNISLTLFSTVKIIMFQFYSFPFFS